MPSHTFAESPIGHLITRWAKTHQLPPSWVVSWASLRPPQAGEITFDPGAHILRPHESGWYVAAGCPAVYVAIPHAVVAAAGDEEKRP
jgi:hypothetical protein